MCLFVFFNVRFYEDGSSTQFFPNADTMDTLPTISTHQFPPRPFLVSPDCVNVVGGGTITLTKRSYAKLGIDEGS